MKSLNIYKNNLNQTFKNQSDIMFVLCYLSSVFTILGGMMHFIMLGPSLKPINFPMEILLYTDSLFVLAGMLQIFWAIPMLLRWSLKWHYIGITGTIGLTALLAITRFPNMITTNLLVDVNPMAMYTEIVQMLYIISTTTIVLLEKFWIIKERKIDIEKKTY